MSRRAERGPRDREIGPIGTVSRVVGGLAAIAVPIALSGVGWWDVGTALVALPLISPMVAALARRAGWSGRSGLVLGFVILLGIALTFVTPVDGSVAIWSFLGVSMLVAALRGDAGCEVLAIPNLITGRNDRISCALYTPIDARDGAPEGEHR